MRPNKLVIIRGGTSMGSITRIYLNVTKDDATKRFREHYPDSYPQIEEIEYDDELIISGYEIFVP